MNSIMKPDVEILDCHPPADDMQAEVLHGLQRHPKHLPSKYFYDGRGARLFEAICETPEYYPTRTEIGILKDALPQLAAALGPDRWVVEPGSGSGIKTDMLLNALPDVAGYVPIDISKAQLAAYAQKLLAAHPVLRVRPVCADFSRDLDLPAEIAAPVIWFPGSTIGNFSPPQAAAFLARLRRWGGGAGELLIGVDLRKPRPVLEAAYNDAQGVTAQFNLNLLHHIRRALDAQLDVEAFVHQARWNDEIGAIQMFLVSTQAQILQLGGQRITVAAGEAICTEYSYKYSIENFQALAGSAGWQTRQVYTDAQKWFAVFHFR